MQKGTQEYVEILEKELQWYKDEHSLILKYKNKDCWYWQGDGEDHLESIVGSLPVVIRADKLRELFKKGN